MPKITFRSATIQDLTVLYEFEQGIITAERPFDPTLKSGHINYYDLKALIEGNTAEVIVAEADQAVVGSGYAQIRKAKDFQAHEYYAYLGFMFVSPEYRGQGIITGILDELKRWCDSRNISEIRLEVYDDNTSAVRAYEKAGFRKLLVEMRMTEEE